MSPISDLLADVDRQWLPGPKADAQKIRLQIIGASALMLQTNYSRGTKDGDVLETNALVEPVRQQLIRLGGSGSLLHKRHGMYLEIVPAGLPFLPQPPAWHSVADLSAKLRHFDVEVLDTLDVVISKLLRFSANDQADIAAMVDRDLIDHAKLIERFKNAKEKFEMDARAEDQLPRCIQNLNQVERDLLQVDETPIELPAWLLDG